MTSLVKYEAARYALQQAHSVDEVKDIRDKAEAMAAYARQAKDLEMIQWVTEIKVRAERKAGQLLAELPKSKGGNPNLPTGHTMLPVAKTLDELGVTKNESSRWQKLASVSDEKFEHAVAAAKDVAGEVTTAAMLRAARDDGESPRNPAVAKPAPVAAVVQPEDPFSDAALNHALLQDLEAADKQVRDLTAMVASLEASDRAREIIQLQERCLGLEGVNRQLNTTLNEAKKDAQSWRKRFIEVGEMVGVKNPAEIKRAVYDLVIKAKTAGVIEV